MQLKRFLNFKNVPFIRVLLEHYKSAEMDLSSIAVAYYLMLTAFPLLVLAANVFPYLNIDTDDLLKLMKSSLPSNIYQSTSQIVVNIFSKPSGGLLGVATLTAFWTMSKSLTSLQKAINKAYNWSQNRNFILSHLVGLGIGFIILFLLTFVLVFSTFTQTILQFLDNRYNLDQSFVIAILELAQPITILVSFLGLMLLYYILPDVKIEKIRFIIPGAVFASTTLILFSNIFSQYMLNSFSRMVDIKVFGSVIVFVIMLWFIFISRVLILGAILNASFQELVYGSYRARPDNLSAFIKHFKSRF